MREGQGPPRFQWTQADRAEPVQHSTMQSTGSPQIPPPGPRPACATAGQREVRACNHGPRRDLAPAKTDNRAHRAMRRAKKAADRVWSKGCNWCHSRGLVSGFGKFQSTSLQCLQRGSIVSILWIPHLQGESIGGRQPRPNHRIYDHSITQYFDIFQEAGFP